MRKMRETKKKEGKERIDDMMMMMREFFGILGLGFPFYSISLLIRTIGKRNERREEKRNLRRDGKGRGQQRPASPQGISPRGHIFLFYYMTGKLTMTFSLVSHQRSWIRRGACSSSFLFLFPSFFLFFGRNSYDMIMIITTIVMAMAIYQSERKMENGSSSSSSSSSSKNVLTFCFCFCFCFLLLLLDYSTQT